MVAIKNAQNLIMQLVFIVKQINPESMYLVYVRKSVENLIQSLFLYMVVMIWGSGGGGVEYMSFFDNEAIFTRRRSLARMIQHTFSNSHQNCSETVSVIPQLLLTQHTIHSFAHVLLIQICCNEEKTYFDCFE